MSRSWYLDEKVALAQQAEMRRIAHEERRATESQLGRASAPLLPRLFSWVDRQVDALRQQTEAWAGRGKSLASQKFSYLDNPDPFRNCQTC
jgi:hypothetical protein